MIMIDSKAVEGEESQETGAIPIFYNSQLSKPYSSCSIHCQTIATATRLVIVGKNSIARRKTIPRTFRCTMRASASAIAIETGTWSVNSIVFRIAFQKAPSLNTLA